MDPFEHGVFVNLIEDGYSGDDAAALARRVAARREQLVANGGKKCPSCSEHRPMTSFDVAPTDDGLTHACRTCRGTHGR